MSRKIGERVTDMREAVASIGGASGLRGTTQAKGLADVNTVMDDFALRGLQALWAIASDPGHPWHDRCGFDALREIVRLTVPKRREVSGPGGGAIDLSLGNIFHSNTLDVGPRE